MMQAVLSLQGKRSKWAITAPMSKAQIEAMREDGVEVGILRNSIPVWIVDAGLLRPWCFFQDIWNIKNPFSS